MNRDVELIWESYTNNPELLEEGAREWLLGALAALGIVVGAGKFAFRGDEQRPAEPPVGGQGGALGLTPGGVTSKTEFTGPGGVKFVDPSHAMDVALMKYRVQLEELGRMDNKHMVTMLHFQMNKVGWPEARDWDGWDQYIQQMIQEGPPHRGNIPPSGKGPRSSTFPAPGIPD